MKTKLVMAKTIVQALYSMEALPEDKHPEVQRLLRSSSEALNTQYGMATKMLLTMQNLRRMASSKQYIVVKQQTGPESEQLKFATLYEIVDQNKEVYQVKFLMGIDSGRARVMIKHDDPIISALITDPDQFNGLVASEQKYLRRINDLQETFEMDLEDLKKQLDDDLEEAKRAFEVDIQCYMNK